MKELTVSEIVTRLVGKIHPIGSSHIDEARFKSLTEYCELAAHMIYNIQQVAKCANGRQEYSLIRASRFAKDWIDETITELSLIDSNKHDFTPLL